MSAGCSTPVPDALPMMKWSFTHWRAHTAQSWNNRRIAMHKKLV